jgi:NAD(P)-dependent dehydrogenase (short-subunit alcohol dehydrogenase family)
MRLKGKTAIVTGAAQGIGLGCAKRFAEEGANVVLVDYNADVGAKAADTLKSAGHSVAFVQCDVGLKPAVDAMVKVANEHFGDIHILLSNAGINRRADFLDLSESDWDQVIQTNLKSVFLCGQAVGRHMVDNKIKGTIINMASSSVKMTMPTISAYAASKGGIAALTNAMSLSLSPRGVRVNAIGPGTIATELTRSALLDDPATRSRILSRTPIGRVGEPEDVAGVAMFLATDDSAYVSGQVIYVEGGRFGLNYTI